VVHSDVPKPASESNTCPSEIEGASLRKSEIHS
jgi:hypothetical protein